MMRVVKAHVPRHQLPGGTPTLSPQHRGAGQAGERARCNTMPLSSAAAAPSRKVACRVDVALPEEVKA